jgi:hypothetical protein
MRTEWPKFGQNLLNFQIYEKYNVIRLLGQAKTFRQSSFSHGKAIPILNFAIPYFKSSS